MEKCLTDRESNPGSATFRAGVLTTQLFQVDTMLFNIQYSNKEITNILRNLKKEKITINIETEQHE